MNRRSRLRKQAGFTFTEVLAAMAILILLLSFSIPAGITMRNRIKHQELEDIARAVYVAAQNTLTRLAASGQTEELDGISMSGFDAPSDIPSETRWETERLDYYYAQNGSDTAKLLLPLGSIDDTVRSGGSYVIEYNKKTSMVYGVFYGKQDFDYRKIGYTEHSFRTDKSVRKSYMIGYYGGSEVERDEFVRCEKPVIQIRNDNVLEAKISGWKSGYMITVTLTDGQNTCGVSQEKLTLNPDGSYTLPLDRLTDDPVEKGRFHERYSTLQPGADLTVSVVFSAAGQISSEASAQTNSLFAARSDDTVSISCARHLQNLDVSYSGVTSDVRKAVQTAALDWTESFYFKSIDNQNLVSYNGNGLEIRALRAENGLFERVLSPDFESKELSGIRIVNPVIRHNGMSEASGAGALAGQTRNVVIRDCGVYAYQLAGETGGTLSVDYDRYLDYGVSAPGGIPAGGLIGEAENSRVEKSFAALPYLSAPAGAGLIGRAADCTISKSYAACDDLRGKALLIGETMAGSRQTEVSDSYAVGNRAISGVTSTPFVFGTADIRNSYYVMSYQSRNGDVLANSEYYVYRADGERRATDQETLSEPAAWNWLIGGEWTALSATLTYPYRKMLDGRPYPYPAGLAHYGSWPTDGTVEVSVKMELWPSGADGTHAGKVILRDEDGVILYQNDKEELNQSIHVKPGTKLTVEIEASEGYLYQQVQIDGKYDTEAAREFTVEKDTLVTVTFQQMAFKLTCGKASYTAGNAGGGRFL